MKGIVFTELLEMVEDTFGPETADRIILASDLPTRGAYTAVGTYDHQEATRLVASLSKETGIPVAELLRTFGQHLFRRFGTLYPHFFAGSRSAFEFLAQIDQYIHVEVQKLYPDAELPLFDYEEVGPDRLVMVYRSKRALSDLADGLIRGCAAHFGETIDLRRDDLSQGQGTVVRFTLTRHAHEPHA